MGKRTTGISHPTSDIRHPSSDIRHKRSDIQRKTLDIRHQTLGISKGRTIRKLIGGEGAGEVQKKYSRKGKLNEKKFMHAN